MGLSYSRPITPPSVTAALGFVVAFSGCSAPSGDEAPHGRALSGETLDERLVEVERLSDRSLLAMVATEDTSPRLRESAVRRLGRLVTRRTDPPIDSVFYRVASEDPNYYVRLEASRRLRDPGLRLSLALEGEFRGVAPELSARELTELALTPYLYEVGDHFVVQAVGAMGWADRVAYVALNAPLPDVREAALERFGRFSERAHLAPGGALAHLSEADSGLAEELRSAHRTVAELSGRHSPDRVAQMLTLHRVLTLPSVVAELGRMSAQLQVRRVGPGGSYTCQVSGEIVTARVTNSTGSLMYSYEWRTWDIGFRPPRQLGCGHHKPRIDIVVDLLPQFLADLSQEALAELGGADGDPIVRHAAMRLLEDSILVTRVAASSRYLGARRAAVSRVTNQALLAEMAMEVHHGDRVGTGYMQEALADRLTDLSALCHIAANGEWRAVKAAAQRRIGEVHPGQSCEAAGSRPDS